MKKSLGVTGKIFGILMILGSIISACGGANRNMADDPEYREMVEEVSNLEFEIEHQWANPTQYARVDLLGNSNRIKFENDSVEVDLPFFGERYAGGGYDPDSGSIQYKGVPKNLKLQENPEKGAVMISFEGNRNTENFDFLITIFSNGVARTSVNSTHRERIIYDGRLINR